MTHAQIQEVIRVLDTVEPPKKLLTQHENHFIPIYSVQAFEDAGKPFRMGVG